MTEHKNPKTNNIYHKKAELITWLLFLISGLLLYFIATNYAVFPSKYKMPLLLVIVALICISGIITILARNSFRYVSIILNVILSILMIAGLILLPNIETRVRNIFKDVRVDEAIISVFSANEKYKENLSDYQNPIFIIQKRNDQENQSYAIEKIKEMLGVSSIKTIEKEDILSAVEALYNNEGDLLILNEAYIDTIEDIEKFNKFSSDTKVVTSIVKQIEVVVEKPKSIFFAPPIKALIPVFPLKKTQRAVFFFLPISPKKKKKKKKKIPLFFSPPNFLILTN